MNESRLSFKFEVVTLGACIGVLLGLWTSLKVIGLINSVAVTCSSPAACSRISVVAPAFGRTASRTVPAGRRGHRISSPASQISAIQTLVQAGSDQTLKPGNLESE